MRFVSVGRKIPRRKCDVWGTPFGAGAQKFFTGDHLERVRRKFLLVGAEAVGAETRHQEDAGDGGEEEKD